MSNPGIVPAWLQRSPDAPAAPASAPAPQSRDAVTLADGLAFRSGARGGYATAREQQHLDDVVAGVQAEFSRMGIRDEEGNGPVVARYNPRYPNASYAPDGLPERNVPPDSITVGRDPRSGMPFSRARDVVAHELAHRVIEHSTRRPLDLSPFSADVAVHESLADTLAALVDDDDWVIGDTLAAPIRVMDDPEQLGHPDHVEDLPRVFGPGSSFVHEVPLKNGDVLRDKRGTPVLVPDWHVVAGIPNKAASIIGNELGRPTMGRIYLNAIRSHVEPGAKLVGFADAVMASARELYGDVSRESQVTRDAWDAVGLLEPSPR